MIGYDDEGNQYGSPAANIKIENTWWTSATIKAERERNERCVKRMRIIKNNEEKRDGNVPLPR